VGVLTVIGVDYSHLGGFDGSFIIFKSINTDKEKPIINTTESNEKSAK